MENILSSLSLSTFWEIRLKVKIFSLGIFLNLEIYISIYSHCFGNTFHACDSFTNNSYLFSKYIAGLITLKSKSSTSCFSKN